jgi:Uma2 family endonuclease
MQLQDRTTYSPAEYLALEETSDFRSEYLDGQIIPMPGGSPNHNQIVGNIYKCLDNWADAHDNVAVFFADLRLWIPQTRTHTYPDLMTIVGGLQMLDNRKDTVTNPSLIVEVLSTSTKDYDRGEKFRFYRSIPSFGEYLLVDQYSTHVEHFAQNAQGEWVFSDYADLSATIALTTLDCPLPLTTIYRKIKFETP